MIYEFVKLPPSAWENTCLNSTRTIQLQPSRLIVEGRRIGVLPFERYISIEYTNNYRIERLWFQLAPPNADPFFVPVYAQFCHWPSLHVKSHLFVNGMNVVLACIRQAMHQGHQSVLSPTEIILSRVQDAIRDRSLGQEIVDKCIRYNSYYAVIKHLAPINDVFIELSYEMLCTSAEFFDHEFYEQLGMYMGLDGYVDLSADMPIPTASSIKDLDTFSRELLIQPLCNRQRLQAQAHSEVQFYDHQRPMPVETPLPDEFETDWYQLRQWCFVTALNNSFSDISVTFTPSGAPQVVPGSIVWKKHWPSQPPAPCMNLPNIYIPTYVTQVDMEILPSHEIVVTIHTTRYYGVIIKYIDLTWYALVSYSVANDH